MKTILTFLVAVLLLPIVAPVASAGGSKEIPPPQVALTAEQESYISPQLSPDIQDGLSLGVSVSASERMVVKGYRVTFRDESGALVRTIAKADTVEPKFFARLFTAMRLKKKIPIEVPGAVEWDGKDDEGRPVAEGRYAYQLEAWDDKGNTARTETYAVIVDNTPPAAEVVLPYSIFSPNGDGNKDLLIVEQSGSAEDAWLGVVRSAVGAEIATYSWENSPAENFSWNGRDAAGARAPDGTYVYEVSSVDRAGNQTTVRVENLIVDTRETTAEISRDLAEFSPNGDGSKDELELTLDVPVSEGVVSWALTVEDLRGVARRAQKGTTPPPPAVIFDGRDDGGRTLAEGRYRVRLEVLYVNGNNPRSTSPEFTVDLTAPTASASADLSIFSPNGDGNKDEVTVKQSASREDSWSAEIRDAGGRAVRSFAWRGAPDAEIRWDGMSGEGEAAPDGRYTYVVFATDRAGNYGQSSSVAFEKDASEIAALSLIPEYRDFSPNGDDARDTLPARLGVSVTEGVERYSLVIRNAAGAAVKTIREEARPPERFVWDGRNDQGLVVADGEYRADLEVVYRNGNTPRLSAGPFVVDTVFPTVIVETAYTLFSPDGDGRRDAMTIHQRTSSEALWEAEVLGADGTPVLGRFWKGQAADFVWDALDDSGNRVPDGTYSYRVAAVDAAQNGASAVVKGIRVDTVPTAVGVNAAARGFSPNGDAVKDQLILNLYVDVPQGIERWSVSVSPEGKSPIRTFAGDPSTPVPSRIVWDGQNDAGVRAPDGPYTAALEVAYEKGNLSTATSPAAFAVDTAGPVISVNLAPQPFSPDADGVDDTVQIRMEAKDPAGIESWAIAIVDPVEHAFIDYSGKGAPPAPFTWNGRSKTGELVQAAEDYPAVFTAVDAYGNRSSLRRVVPVDVLVIRDGDRLKIAISSITFAPNSADFTSFDAEKAQRNNKTLNRLAEILRKYPTHQIRVEGHAASEWWNVPARAAREQTEELIPLSQKRADAIRDALVTRGIEAARMTTAGIGGATPVVPHGDLDNRWKNRRVEFLLIRS